MPTDVALSIPSKNPFNLSHDSFFTAGSQLVTPCGTPEETLPGHFFEYDPSLVVELFPFNSLFFSSIKAHVDSFFCSYRSIYGDLWYKYFLLDQLQMPKVDISLITPGDSQQTISITNQYFKVMDMLGYPIGLSDDQASYYHTLVNPTKYFMYWRIIRDYYCDPVIDADFIQKLDEIFLSLNVDSIFDSNNPLSSMPSNAVAIQAILDNRARDAFVLLWNMFDTPQDSYVPSIFHRRLHRDYFTSLLPDLQFGEPMRVPIQGPFVDDVNGTAHVLGTSTANARNIQPQPLADVDAYSQVYVLGGTIRDLERLESVQRFKERLNFAGGQGSNAKDLSEAIFGDSPDTISIHRSMWLNSFSRDVVLNEVVSTTPNQSTTTDASDGLGSKVADGMIAARGDKFSVFTKEHGYIFSMFSLMPSVAYAYCPRDSFKRSLQEYYLPDLAFIGEQEVLGQELISVGNQHSQDPVTGLYPQESLVGYQPRYEEYRSKPNELHGGFRSTEAQHMIFGRVFNDKINLSPDFIQYSNEFFNRIFSYVNPDADTCFVHMHFQIMTEAPIVENPTKV